MAQAGFKRKLTAILSADAKGYSRLMRADEEATIRTLTAYRGLMATLIEQYRGRVVDSPGDNVLAEFASVVDAVKCSVEIQRELAEQNATLSAQREMKFRIGINLGDVVEEGERIYGDGVNIAARVENICEAGEICISGTAFEHVENKLDFEFEDLGEHTVKNIDKPVQAYRIISDPGAAAYRVNTAKKATGRTWRTKLLVIAAIVVAGAVAAVWRFYGHFSSPSVEVASADNMAFPLPDKPSIAVLPFVNMSDDPQQEYFSDGITEDIITDLSAISQLFVIARNSTFTYKGRPVKIRQVAEELGVRYVLEGSVRKAGNKVRINAQLIDATAGHHLWAKRYDGELIDVFALQDKISKQIVSALKVKLTVNEQAEVDGQETKKIEAYDAFLKGWKYYLRNTPQDWAKALSHFENAVALDPEYSRPHAAMALIYWRYTRISRYSVFQESELNVNNFEASVRAHEHLQLAMRWPTSINFRLEASIALYRRQYKRALTKVELAVDLNPNDVDSIYTMAYILSAKGEPDRALDFINSGMRLDPHNIAQPLYLLGVTHFAKGEFEEAVSMIERALKHNPKFPRPAPILPAALAHLGQVGPARMALENWKKTGTYDVNFRSIMYNFPFQDPEMLERLAEGLRKAGLPAVDYKFYKLLTENMLDGEEIRKLVFGREVITYWAHKGTRLLIERKEDGEAKWYSHPDKYRDGSGRSSVEDDQLCDQWEGYEGGLKHCGSVFRNPEGTAAMHNEYIAVSDFGFRLFSPVD